jgi:multiple sugar transport system permease protein
VSTDLKSQTRGAPAPAFRVPRPGRSKVFRGLGLILLIVIAATFVLPILWSVSTSLRIPAESYDNPPQWIPLNPVWSNYAAVFQQVPLATFFLNSVLVTGAIVVLQLITSTMSGYAFALVRFRGKGAVFAMVLATMMVPAQTTIIPIFILIRYLGLSDNLWSLVIPAFGGAFGTFLMRQYFLQMPGELAEAARVDGASNFQIFTRIYAPIALPPMATLAVLNFSAYWNEFFRPLIFLQSTENFTLPIGLVSLQGNFGTGSVSIVLAGVVIALIPSIAIFLLAQRYFVEGITAGSFR